MITKKHFRIWYTSESSGPGIGMSLICPPLEVDDTLTGSEYEQAIVASFLQYMREKQGRRVSDWDVKEIEEIRDHEPDVTIRTSEDTSRSYFTVDR